MVMGPNLCHVCLFGGHQRWCNAWSRVSNFCLLGVSGGVVHGLVFESLVTFWGSMGHGESMVVYCMSWVRIFVFLGVINGGVVHGLGFEFLSFGGSKVV
jgi:hypothetical protein